MSRLRLDSFGVYPHFVHADNTQGVWRICRSSCSGTDTLDGWSNDREEYALLKRTFRKNRYVFRLAINKYLSFDGGDIKKAVEYAYENVDKWRNK